MAPENTEILLIIIITCEVPDAEGWRNVNNVIKLEQPYCTEDYWFLADYYREKEQISKSFHF